MSHTGTVMREQSVVDPSGFLSLQTQRNGPHRLSAPDFRFFQTVPNQSRKRNHFRHLEINFWGATNGSGWSLGSIVKVYSRTGSAGELMFDARLSRCESSFRRDALRTEIKRACNTGACEGVLSFETGPAGPGETPRTRGWSATPRFHASVGCFL